MYLLMCLPVFLHIFVILYQVSWLPTYITQRRLCLSGFILVTETQVTFTNIHMNTQGHGFHFKDTKTGNNGFT